jgi:hypothetical protein
MTPEKKDRDHQKTLREFYEAKGDKSAVWINDETGQIVDSLPVESRIRPGSGGCQLCHEDLAVSEVDAPRQQKVEQRHRSVDLVGRAPDQQHAVTADIRTKPIPMLPDRRPVLLLGKRGGP